MEELPLSLVKKIELKLENSIESAKQLIEPLLKEYKGEEILFKKKDSNWFTKFTIGSSTNQSNLSINLTPDVNNTTIMTLAIIFTNSSSQGETMSQIAKRIDILIEDILFHIINDLKIKEKAKIIEKGKQCNKCKKVNDLDAQFCKICGNKISEKPSKPSQEPPLESPALPRLPKKLSEPSKPSQEPPLESPALPRLPKKLSEPSRPSQETSSISKTSHKSPKPPNLSQKTTTEAFAPSSQISSVVPDSLEEQPQSTQGLIKVLDLKYPNKYECGLCEIKCAYKDPFILLLNDVKNLKEPFKKFDEFLHTKDLLYFSDFIYNFAQDQLKRYPKFSLNELPNIAYCIFSILSFHILEKADQKIRLTFAEKMKTQINDRFNKENTSLSDKSLMGEDIGAAFPTIKTGLLHIEENRCPYCYRKFDERTLKLKIKGYPVNCPNCDHPL